MKVASIMRKQVFLLWCFGMVIQLHFLLGAGRNLFESGDLRANENKNISSDRVNSRSSQSPVTMNTYKDKVVLANGFVTVTFANPEGYILGLSYSGIDNVFDTKHHQTDRGYFDVVWNEPKNRGIFQRVDGTKFSIIEQDKNKVEVSFSRTWTTSMNGSVPMNIDKRYILRKGDSGFYSYVIFDRRKNLPSVEVYQIRYVYKLNERFNYMAISDTRQRNMPTEEDRQKGQQLAYPEAVLITHPSNPKFQGEVDDKYQYMCENKDNILQGWITNDDSKEKVGIWLITPSNEFRNGGPHHQDLTSHAGPILLNMFVSTHYGGISLGMTFAEGETHKKVYGPFYTYLNSGASDVDYKSLWSDAVQEKDREIQSWPYDFIGSKDFLPADQRGRVAGVLKIQDWYITKNGSEPAKYAYVGLAVPGNAGSWQVESKGYQFWTQANEDGYFEIKNILPGEYNLYAWVPGFISDYKYETKITVKPGSNLKFDSLVYYPPRNGPTLWEIGIPDRTAAEFYVPDPYPTLMNNLYRKTTGDKFREYGLWSRYADLYPKNDLVFTVGVSDYKKDWFYAHVTRKNEDNTYQAVTWQIVFQLDYIPGNGNYTLQLALASANGAELQVRVNEPITHSPLFTTGLIGGDNAIARHGIHGLYWQYSITIPCSNLVKGENIMYLTQARAKSPFAGVLYDYIRLESPPIKGV